MSTIRRRLACVVCLILLVSGLSAARVEAWPNPNPNATPVVGSLDLVSWSGGTLRVAGWATTAQYPSAAIGVRVRVDGNLVSMPPPGYYLAGQYRWDVGYHAFDFTIASPQPVFTVCVEGQNAGYYNAVGNCSVQTNISGNSIISRAAGPSSITIATQTQWAGAISYLTWGGKQFINSLDHGRLMQSAAFFNPSNPGHPECFNPTEAGTQADTSSSTSVIRSFSYNATQISSTVFGAFFFRPADCSLNKELSGFIFGKTVTLGAFPGIDLMIKYDVGFISPNETTPAGTIEWLTAYMPPDFTLQERYVRSTGAVVAAPPSTYTGSPIMYSTSDGAYSMGYYCPGLVHGTFNNPLNGQPVAKWNAYEVYSGGLAPSTALNKTCYVAVGSRANVAVSFNQLFANYPSIP